MKNPCYCSFSLFTSWIVVDSISIERFFSSFVSSKSRFFHQFSGHVWMQFFVCCCCLSLVDLLRKFSFGRFKTFGDEFEWIVRCWSNIVFGTSSNPIDGRDGQLRVSSTSTPLQLRGRLDFADPTQLQLRPRSKFSNPTPTAIKIFQSNSTPTPSES